MFNSKFFFILSLKIFFAQHTLVTKETLKDSDASYKHHINNPFKRFPTFINKHFLSLSHSINRIRELNQHNKRRKLESRLLNDLSMLTISNKNYQILIKNKDNTYTNARDNRVFITDSGYLKITYEISTYSSSPIQLTYYTLTFNNGVSLLTAMTDEEHEIIIKGTQRIITYIKNIKIIERHTITLYAKFSPLYESKQNINEAPLSFRSMIEGIVLGYKSTSQVIPSSDITIKLPDQGLSQREQISMTISVNNNALFPYRLKFAMEFIFVPRLINYDNYYFKILRTKLLKEEEEELWETIACEPYHYAEFEYDMIDCTASNINDCLYYFKLELYLDEQDSTCENGYLSSSIIIKFPADNPLIEVPEDMPTVTLPSPKNRFPYVTIVLCIIAILTLIGLVGYSCYKLLSLTKNRLTLEQSSSQFSDEHSNDKVKKLESTSQTRTG